MNRAGRSKHAERQSTPLRIFAGFALCLMLAGLPMSVQAQKLRTTSNTPKACMVDIGLKGGVATDSGKPANPRYCQAPPGSTLGSECTCVEWGRGVVVVSPDIMK